MKSAISGLLIASVLSTDALAQNSPIVPTTETATMQIPAASAGPARGAGPADPTASAVTSPSAATTTPPPATTGTLPSGQALVLSGGVLNAAAGWSGDFNYGGAVASYRFTNPIDGKRCLKMKATAGGTGGGGWQPYFIRGAGANAGGFPASSYKYLNFSLMPTRAGQIWSSVFAGTGDAVIPGQTVVNIESYGPAPQPNVWATYKVPLGDGGYTLPADTTIAKFNLQDQMPYGAEKGNAVGNVYYVNNVYFSTD